MSHKGVFLISVVVLFTRLAQAQNRIELFGGYSFLHGPVNTPEPVDMHLNGWNASVATKLMPHVQLVADVGGYYETLQVFACGEVPNLGCGPFSTHIYDALFGPQVSLSIAKLRPFAHALFGVAHLSTRSTSRGGFSDSDTAYSNALGGGLDYWLTHRLGLRAQADYFPDRFFGAANPRQNNLRFSTGIMFRP